MIFSDTSSLIPFAFLLMGLIEGALGRDGSVLFVCGGPGDWSSITCAHTFSILKYEQKLKYVLKHVAKKDLRFFSLLAHSSLLLLISFASFMMLKKIWWPKGSNDRKD